MAIVVVGCHGIPRNKDGFYACKQNSKARKIPKKAEKSEERRSSRRGI
jgi:hypothetical protein